MDSTQLYLLLLTTFQLSYASSWAETDITISCPDYQEGFDSSCYEFVSPERSFLGAQGWCERGGGHLAFILNEETQQFLQKHLDPEKDWWLGLAPASPNLTLDIAAAEDHLSWLDGSDFSYSNWMNILDPEAACGHILKESGFRWEATHNCSQELPFICEFESGRSIACADHKATLQCGSGQVIEIDDSFYGRKTVYYCRSDRSPSTISTIQPTQEECSWLDVSRAVKGHCHGLQACQATADVASFGEPCPGQGSYLSVEYHCKDGLHLSMSKLAAVLDNVTITVKWLLHPFQGNLTCTLSAGDGHTIDPYSPAELESSVVHRYTRPGVFMVGVDCTTSDWHVTAQKTITIQEPIGEFGFIKCYSRNQSTDGDSYRALYGSPFQIQLELEAGTNVTYKVLNGDVLLANSSVVRGIVPHNITVSPEVEERLGPGCHQLTLHASNGVTTLGVTAELQLCLAEPIEGLQASLVKGQCPESPGFNIGVSVEKGFPVQLLFSVTGDNDSLSETRELLNCSLHIFHIANIVQAGFLQVIVRASNAFSSKEVKLANIAACNNYSVQGPENNRNLKSASVRVRKATSMEITVTPNQVTLTNQSVLLRIVNLNSGSTDVQSAYEWECKYPCKCQGIVSHVQTYDIPANCLPDPFVYFYYTFTLRNERGITTTTETYSSTTIRTSPNHATTNVSENGNNDGNGNDTGHGKGSNNGNGNDTGHGKGSNNGNGNGKDNGKDQNKNNGNGNGNSQTVHKCITVNPPLFTDVSISCQGCNPVNVNSNVIMSLACQNCPAVVWGFEDTRNYDSLSVTSDQVSCYEEVGQKPLILTVSGNKEYQISSINLQAAQSTSQNITVVAYGQNQPGYAKFTIQIPPAPTTTPKTTTSHLTSAHTTIPHPATPVNTPLQGVTNNNFGNPVCTIYPPKGTVLDAFTFTCKTSSPCSACQYCFETDTGIYIQCSNASIVRSIYLPLGDKSNSHSLTIVATIKNGTQKSNSTIITEVDNPPSTITVQALQSAVENTVAQLAQQGVLSGEALGQMFSSVSDILNEDSNATQTEARKALRETMLRDLTTALVESPNRTPQAVQVTANALAGLLKQGTELSLSSQLSATHLAANISSSLLAMASDENQNNEILKAATQVVEIANNIQTYSSNKIITNYLLSALNDVQSALLKWKTVDQGPTVISQAEISLFVKRVDPGTIYKQPFYVPDGSSAMFIFPPVLANILPQGAPVDVRMISFKTNPYSWKEGGNVSGCMGSASIARENGSVIPVENLSQEIEIHLPRPFGEVVNSTVLDLGNYSTMVIDVLSTNASLVLKLEPSTDPLPFILYLGYKSYPNDNNNVAKTTMPQNGTTQEERYTWILSPKDLKGNIGRHYLLVRPIVGPGIKTIKENVSVTSIAAQCKYWDESISDWSDYGCRVGPLTKSLFTQCFCNHLTTFGSSFFVMPNLVDVSQTASLFASFASNPVVVCFVGAIFVAYLLVAVWARRKDLQDVIKVKVTVLEDNDPLDEYRYMLSVSTGNRFGACTSAQVAVVLLGTEGESEPHHLCDPEKPVFEGGGVDMFLLTTPFSLGELQSVRLWHDNSGGHPSWYVNKVIVQDLENGQKWDFLCNSWLALDVGECTLDKVFYVASEKDLKTFSNLFFMKTIKDFRDGHIWYSIIYRPPSSTFTRVQRVSCCFSLLLCTMLTSLMFYGIPKDPSEQTMNLGPIQFNWQQFMIGIQSSIIMFPINLIIVSIFRNTRPREKKPNKPKAEASKKGNKGCVSPSQTSSPQKELTDITPDTVIKDIKRIAQSLSKARKSPIPRLELELGSGHQADINVLLSLVEDIIRQQNRAGGEFYSDASKKDGSVILSLGAVDLQESVCEGPEKPLDGFQKKRNNSQYLYRQLRHVENELSFLGQTHFPDPVSYSRAVQQVQGMKSLLEAHLSSSTMGGELASIPSPVESTNGDSSKKCCQGGLPWWFVFVGWILVIATSVVSGYFTMMYGLTYGKDRSINWLISTVVSFCQSLFVTEPIKVLCLAVFFSLVLKKVEQEDLPVVEQAQSANPGALRATRKNSGLYHPPLPADIDMMKRNKIKDLKVNALIREIIVYVGFMWMLLLVAYGQRDPNAYLLNQHIQNSFSNGIAHSMSHKDIFTWANTGLLSNLFGVYPGFITDGNSKLVGSARFRQVRVQKNSCRLANSMRESVPDCHAPYSWEVEDMGAYGPGWNRSVGDNTSQTFPSPWKYQSEARLRAYPIWGSVVLYRGGGFVVELGPDSVNANSTLQYLFNNTWLDTYTRAVFVEFTVYNANVNLFCIVTLMLETPAVGAFQFRSEMHSVRLYQSPGGFHIFVMASEIIYFLFILYYMFVQGKLMKQQRLSYFRSKRNLVELSIILLSWSALSVYIKRTLLGNRDMAYYQSHKDQFASFIDTASADAVLGYLIAFLVLLATVKLWHLMRLNPKLHMITATLKRAWIDISGFLVVIFIMILAYSITVRDLCNLLFGWKLYTYRTLTESVMTIICLQLGIFNYDEVLTSNPVLGTLLIFSCVVLMTFVVLNLFVAVIMKAFTHERINHKPSEEEEIVDLMLIKICSLFGIKFSKTHTTNQSENSGPHSIERLPTIS